MPLVLGELASWLPAGSEMRNQASEQFFSADLCSAWPLLIVKEMLPLQAQKGPWDQPQSLSGPCQENSLSAWREVDH